MLRYRNDIDGLRAVAVVPIVLYHAGVSQISGGFIGVDVFFVISGFLITSIMLGDIEAGRFSVVAFWGKRIVRIFPALFVMLAGVMIAGCLFLFPGDLRALAFSTAAAAAFVSNIWFEFTTGYFGPAAETLPLLHTWSLGVEDQFYIVHPAPHRRRPPLRPRPAEAGAGGDGAGLVCPRPVALPVDAGARLLRTARPCLGTGARCAGRCRCGASARLAARPATWRRWAAPA